MALVGLLLVLDALLELWTALADTFDHTGFAAWLIWVVGLEYVGPMTIVTLAVAGGLLFAFGCMMGAPHYQKK